MRKLSKSRADDDVVSSTNGSVLCEEQPEAERQADPDEKEPESESNENVESNEHESTSTTKESPAKKGKAKNKTKKRKSEKDKTITEEEYEVERIVDSKRIKGKLHYLIRWKGYSANNDTWEPENTLSCPELINKFNEEKENSKNKDGKPEKKNNKRKAKKEIKVPSKRPKNDWDGKTADENAEYEEYTGSVTRNTWTPSSSLLSPGAAADARQVSPVAPPIAATRGMPSTFPHICFSRNTFRRSHHANFRCSECPVTKPLEYFRYAQRRPESQTKARRQREVQIKYKLLGLKRDSQISIRMS